MSTARIIGTVQYFQKAPRQFNYIQVGRKTWRSSSEVRSSAVWRGCETAQEGLVDGGDVARDDVLYGGLGIGSCHSSLSAGRAESLPVGPSRPTHKREPLGSKLMEWLRAHPASPLTSVLQTRHWSESPFGLTVMRSSTVLANVFNNYALELFDLTIVELYERYAKIDPQQLIFAAPLGNIQSTYFDIDESVRILDELLSSAMSGGHGNCQLFPVRFA